VEFEHIESAELKVFGIVPRLERSTIIDDPLLAKGQERPRMATIEVHIYVPLD
jgi:hypothetical protein